MPVLENEDENETARRVLVEGFQRRDPEAVRQMYRAYGRLVFIVAHRVLGRHDLAEEATQITFVNAWRAAERVDAKRDPAPWLATIAKRAAIDIYRRESVRSAAALDDVAANEPAMVSQPLDIATIDAALHVRRAIDQLSPDEAAIVRLQHLEGMTHPEISVQLDIPLGTVKSRSHRAHRHLAGMLGHLRNDSDIDLST